MIEGLIGGLFNGISIGAVLLIVALGLAIVFGLMGVINLAHGELMMLGAYTTYVVQNVAKTMGAGAVEAYIFAALPMAFLVAALVGLILERGVIRHLYGRPLETLLATWGVSLILRQFVRSVNWAMVIGLVVFSLMVWIVPKAFKVTSEGNRSQVIVPTYLLLTSLLLTWGLGDIVETYIGNAGVSLLIQVAIFVGLSFTGIKAFIKSSGASKQTWVLVLTLSLALVSAWSVGSLIQFVLPTQLILITAIRIILAVGLCSYIFLDMKRNQEISFVSGRNPLLFSSIASVAVISYGISWTKQLFLPLLACGRIFEVSGLPSDAINSAANVCVQTLSVSAASSFERTLNGAWFSARNVDVTAPSWLRGGISIGTTLQFPYARLFIIVLTVLCLLGVYWFLNRTSWGLRMRSVTQNRTMSACLGIPTEQVDALTFALGSGLAGIAGCAVTLLGSVGPNLGGNYIVDAFMVVVVGGVGKLVGSIVAAMVIGVITYLVGSGTLALLVSPYEGLKPLMDLFTFFATTSMAKVMVFAMIIAFLQVKPAGMFPQKGRTVEV